MRTTQRKKRKQTVSNGSIDLRQPPNPATDKAVKKKVSAKTIFLKIVGLISLGLGFAGLFLPLLPTTPFILLSGWCFARSSPKWHRWIHEHHEFGPLIENWNRNRSISKRHKAFAVGILAMSVISVWLSASPQLTDNLRMAITGGLLTIGTFLLATKSS